MRGKNECRGCGSKNLFQALDLGFSPLANKVVQADRLERAEPWFPLVLRVCTECQLGQLGEFASDATIFRDYPYLSSTSSTWLEENKKFADRMITLLELGKDDLIVELASNDGYLLQYFMERNMKILGVEPALNVATIAALKGVPTSPEFFTESLAEELVRRHVAPRLIIAKNVVAHVPDLRDFLTGISVLASESTLIVIEAPSIINILQKMQFDTIYHEHFSYLSATFFNSLRCFITRENASVALANNLLLNLEETLNLERLSGFGEPTTWRNLESQLKLELKKIRSWFSNPVGRIIGYGAAAKAVTLLSAAQVPRGLVSLCIDNSKEKMDRYIPGSHIRIVSESTYIQDHLQAEDIYVIFPWNLKSEISKRIRQFNPNARIFVLLPSVQEI